MDVDLQGGDLIFSVDSMIMVGVFVEPATVGRGARDEDDEDEFLHGVFLSLDLCMKKPLVIERLVNARGFGDAFTGEVVLWLTNPVRR
jgi:hypothetical protein